MVLITVLLTFGSDYVMIQIMMIIFLIVDPTLGILTLFVIRRYSEEGYDAERAGNEPKDMTQMITHGNAEA